MGTGSSVLVGVGSSVGAGLGSAVGDGTAVDRPGTVTGGPADADAEMVDALLGGGAWAGVAEQDAITSEQATPTTKAATADGVRALMLRTLPSPRPGLRDITRRGSSCGTRALLWPGRALNRAVPAARAETGN